MTADQKLIIDICQNLYQITETTDSDKCEAHKSVGVTERKDKRIYDIYYHDKLTAQEREVIRIHEYGHAYYHHLELNLQKEYDYVCKLVWKLRKKVMSAEDIHYIINVAMDIQINSSLLTFKDIRTIRNYGAITASMYDVEGGLNFREYYEVIISQLKFKSDESEDKSESKIDRKGSNIILTGSESIDDTNTDLIIDINSEGDGVGDDQYKDEVDSIKAIQLNPPKGGGKDVGGDESPIFMPSQGAGQGFDDAMHELKLHKVEDTDEDRIRKLIESIPGDRANYSFKLDSLRTFNRKTRSTQNLMYSSVKRGRRPRQLPKLGVVVDVSGSMSEHIVRKVFSTLKSLQHLFDKESVVVTWNTSRRGEWKISDLPNKIYSSGGTDLNASIKYCKDHLKCNKYLVISDMDFSLYQFTRSMESTPMQFYAISYDFAGDASFESNFIKFLKL